MGVKGGFSEDNTRASCDGKNTHSDGRQDTCWGRLNNSFASQACIAAAFYFSCLGKGAGGVVLALCILPREVGGGLLVITFRLLSSNLATGFIDSHAPFLPHFHLTAWRRNGPCMSTISGPVADTGYIIRGDC